MGTRNHDNNLKCEVAGYKGWRETKFFAGKNPDGTVRTRDGFKNVLTDQEWHGKEPPGPTGDLATVRHCSDAYKEGWERIWGKNQSEETPNESTPCR